MNWELRPKVLSDPSQGGRGSPVLMAILVALIVALSTPAAAAPAPNDAFGSRTTIATVPFTEHVSTVDSTKEPGELDPPCGGIGKTVWYEYTPPADVMLGANTRGSDFDTVLGVWTGSTLSALTPVGCSDDSFELESRVIFFAQAGTTYFFQVGGYGDRGGNLRFALQSVDAGMISGTISEQASGARLESICVEVVDPEFFSFSFEITDAAGNYRVAVRSGRYLVRFYDECDEVNDHKSQWFNNRPNFEAADEVKSQGRSRSGTSMLPWLPPVRDGESSREFISSERPARTPSSEGQRPKSFAAWKAPTGCREVAGRISFTDGRGQIVLAEEAATTLSPARRERTA